MAVLDYGLVVGLSFIPTPSQKTTSQLTLQSPKPNIGIQKSTQALIKHSSPSTSSTISTTTMGEAIKIMRSSIHTFLQSYHCFSSIAALLALPVAAIFLLLLPSSTPSLTIQIISSRLNSLFVAAGFPATSHLFTFLNLKLSQTIFSFIFTLPLSITFLILTKASVIRAVRNHPHHRSRPPPFSSFLHLYRPLLFTHIFNSFILLTANASVFTVLFLAFNTTDVIGLSSINSSIAISAAGILLYSVVLANATVTCSLATVVSAIDNSGGYLPVLKACVLIRGRVTTALALALPINLAMAAVEALFHLRVARPYQLSSGLNPGIVCEGFMVSYMYSVLMVLDVIVSCMFFKSCESRRGLNWADGHDYHRVELEPEEKV